MLYTLVMIRSFDISKIAVTIHTAGLCIDKLGNRYVHTANEKVRRKQ